MRGMACHVQMNRTMRLVRTNADVPARKDPPVSTTQTSRKRPLLIVSLAALLALPVLAAAPSPAEADVKIRVRGSAKVSAKVRVGTPAVRVRVRPRHRHRPHVTHRPRTRLHVGARVVVGGGIYVGTGYATPPPPPPAYDCDVPAYYSRPVQPAPVIVHPAPVHRDMGPRLGIGAFVGGTATEYSEGDDVGLVARYRLTHGLALEGELSRTENERVETRRAGGALVWDLMPHSWLSPHLLGGLGRWDDGNYAELGAGLTWRLSDRFHLALDFRAGLAGNDEGDEIRPLASGQVIDDDRGNEPQEYSRGRLSALLYF